MKKEENVLNETEETVEKKEAEKPEEKGGTHATSGAATVSKVQPANDAVENEKKVTVEEAAAKEPAQVEEDLAAKWSGNIINKEWCENYLKNTTMGRITMICSVLLLICLAVLCVMTFIVMFRVRSA